MFGNLGVTESLFILPMALLSIGIPLALLVVGVKILAAVRGLEVRLANVESALSAPSRR